MFLPSRSAVETKLNRKEVALLILLIALPSLGLRGATARSQREIVGDLVLTGGNNMVFEDTDLVVKGEVVMSEDSTLTLTRSTLTVIPPAASGVGGYIRMTDRSSLMATDSTLFSSLSMGIVASGESIVRLKRVTISDGGLNTNLRYSIETWTFSDALKDYRIFSGVSISGGAELFADGIDVGQVSTSSASKVSLTNSLMRILSPSKAGNTVVNNSVIGLLMLQAGGGTIMGSPEGAHSYWSSAELGVSGVSRVSLFDTMLEHLWITAVGDVTLRDADLTIAVLNGGTYTVEGCKIQFLAMLNGAGVSTVTRSTTDSFGVFSFNTQPGSAVKLDHVTIGRAKFNSFSGGITAEADNSEFGQLFVNYGAQPDSRYAFRDCLIGDATVVSSPSLTLGFNNTRVSKGVNLVSPEEPTSISITGGVDFGAPVSVDQLGVITIVREYSVAVSQGITPLSGVKVDLRGADQTIRSEVTDSNGYASFRLQFTGGPGSVGNFSTALRLFTIYNGETRITPLGVFSNTPVYVRYGVVGEQGSQIIAAVSVFVLLSFAVYVIVRTRV
jgi:hypothetical protein